MGCNYLCMPLIRVSGAKVLNSSQLPLDLRETKCLAEPGVWVQIIHDDSAGDMGLKYPSIAILSSLMEILQWKSVKFPKENPFGSLNHRNVKRIVLHNPALSH